MITLSLSEKAISSEKNGENSITIDPYTVTQHMFKLYPLERTAPADPSVTDKEKKTRNKKSIVPPPGKMHTDRQGHLLHINDGANAPWKK